MRPVTVKTPIALQPRVDVSQKRKTAPSVEPDEHQGRLVANMQLEQACRSFRRKPSLPQLRHNADGMPILVLRGSAGHSRHRRFDFYSCLANTSTVHASAGPLLLAICAHVHWQALADTREAYEIGVQSWTSLCRNCAYPRQCRADEPLARICITSNLKAEDTRTSLRIDCRSRRSVT